MSMPHHVAIIMDGNGRWAQRRGLSRVEGHLRGVSTLRQIIVHASERGLSFLTLFAFSSENWMRPKDEVHELMDILKLFIERDLSLLHRNRVQIQVLGQRDALDPSISALLSRAESLTFDNEGLRLFVAFNYGSQDEIVRATRLIAVKVADGLLDPEEIDGPCFAEHLYTAGVPEPDLLVRTGGERRLSNFLLWQCAYTEFIFLDMLWPDFDEQSFDNAIAEFNQRDRRFGRLGFFVGT
ncbi:MAG: polyprenyl diphosphate synthase [Alphaproteobacteria bacterium]|nr:polyprenyl diphosphate synthase [Alphaproteobacteria bacterium]